MQAKTVSWSDIRQQVLAHPEVLAEYEALEEEFKLIPFYFLNALRLLLPR
jgi:hypothetical protein